MTVTRSRMLSWGFETPSTRSHQTLMPVNTGRNLFKAQMCCVPIKRLSNEGTAFVDETQAIKEDEEEGLVDEISGSGALDVARAVMQLKRGINKDLSMKGKGKNPNARSGFPGEKHLRLPTSSGPGLTKANFCGPGTNLEKRLARGDQGISQIDNSCKKHDIAYSKARSKTDIRKADNDLIRNINKATDAGRIQKSILKTGLRLKKLGENIGVFGPETFTNIPSLRGEGVFDKQSNFLNNCPRDMRSLVNNTRSTLPLTDRQRMHGNGIAISGQGHANFQEKLEIRGDSSPMAFTDLSARKAVDPTISHRLIGSGVNKKADPEGGTMLNPAELLRRNVIKKLKKEKKGGQFGVLAGLAASVVVPEIIKAIRGGGMQVGKGDSEKIKQIVLAAVKTAKKKNKGGKQAGGLFGLLAGIAASVLVPEIVKVFKRKR